MWSDVVSALVADLDPNPPRGAGVGDVEAATLAPGRRVQQRVGGRLADQQLQRLTSGVGLWDGGGDELAGQPDLARLADKPVQPANLRHPGPPRVPCRLNIDQALMALEQAVSARRDFISLAGTTSKLAC